MRGAVRSLPLCVNDTVLDSAEAQLHLAGISFFLTCEERQHFMQCTMVT
jgi:hypothetical protein